MASDFNRDSLRATGLILQDLHSVWTPHEGQVKVGNALFYKDKKYIFLRCGRKFGKTDLVDYIPHRFAMLNPNSCIYYVAPYYNQAAELIWHTGRLPNFLKHLKDKYVKKQYDTDKRLVFHNGSFIKLLGSDNFVVAAGHTPDLIIYDEFADFDPRFDKAMRPNLAPKKAPIIIVGSPAHTSDSYYYKVEDEFRMRENGEVFIMPTHINPHIDKQWLKEEESSYRERGEYATFQREYLAMKVFGGADAIFPMLLVPEQGLMEKYTGFTKHYVSYADKLAEIKRRYKDYDFYCSFDAGTVTCFAVLFIAIHRYSKKVTCLNSIYETDQGKTTTKQIFPRALEIINSICADLDRWTMIYDNAAAWFAQEVQHEFDHNLFPCMKDLNKKEVKLSLIKDLMVYDRFEMTDECPKLMWEMSNYQRDANGKIPKKNDHLIDDLRYILNQAGYDTVPRDPWVDPKVELGWRHSIDVEYSNNLNEDIRRGFYGDSY